LGRPVEHRTGRWRNNRLEQDNRGIKGRYKPMQSFKNPVSAARFCQAFDEQKRFFNFRRWHNDRWRDGYKRANFKSKFYDLKSKFSQKKLVWTQSIMPLLLYSLLIISHICSLVQNLPQPRKPVKTLLLTGTAPCSSKLLNC
jgi:alpha-amylase/alpha-mannosidase (GH57 family)